MAGEEESYQDEPVPRGREGSRAVVVEVGQLVAPNCLGPESEMGTSLPISERLSFLFHPYRKIKVNHQQKGILSLNDNGKNWSLSV